MVVSNAGNRKSARRKEPKMLFPLREKTVKKLKEIFYANRDKISSADVYNFASDILDKFLNLIENNDLKSIDIYIKIISSLYRNGYLPIPFSVVSEGKLDPAKIKESFKVLPSNLYGSEMDKKDINDIINVYFYAFLHVDNIRINFEKDMCCNIEAMLTFPIREESIVKNFYQPSLEGLIEGMGFRVLKSKIDSEFVSLYFCK
jgi:hypothetical protein